MSTGGYLSRRRSGIFASFMSQSGAETADLQKIEVSKDEKGYGFQVSGEYPAHVVKVRQGSIAQKNGLEANDIVVTIDNENVTNMSHDHIVNRIRQRESFSLLVQKRSNTSHKQKTLSHPIAFSQNDEIARLGGYDITCNMITSEYKRLVEFREQSNDPSLPDTEKAKLKSLINTSQQIIQNLQRKIPESYFKRMSLDASLLCDSDQTDSFKIPEDKSITRLSDAEAEPDETSTPRKLVQRRSSVNERIARTHSIAQDVIANFRSLRKQQYNPKLSQYGSLQSLAGPEMLSERRRNLSKKNTISDSNLNQQLDTEHQPVKPLAVETNHLAASPFPRNRSNSKNQMEIVTSCLSFTVNPQSVTIFLRHLLTFVCCEEHPQPSSESMLETVKELFFMTFVDGIENKKEEEFHKYFSTIIRVFCLDTSPLYLNCFREASLGITLQGNSLDLVFSPLCHNSIQTHAEEMISLFPTLIRDISNRVKADIEMELNKLIPLIEMSKCSLFTETVKQYLGDSIVTFLKLNKKRYKDNTAILKRHKASYANLFGKKAHSINSNKSLKESKSGHMFQSVAGATNVHLNAASDVKCASCFKTTVAGQPLNRCVSCGVVVHATCAANFPVACSSMTPVTPNGTKHSPSIHENEGFPGAFSPPKVGSDETDSITSSATTSSAVRGHSRENSSVSLGQVAEDPTMAESALPLNQPHSLPPSGTSANNAVKRTVSMKNENETRHRKPSISPRNASDPCHHLVNEVNVSQGAKVNSGESNEDFSTSDMSSSNLSRTSLDSYLERIDPKVRELLDVVNWNHSSFLATDNFKTIDQLATKEVHKSLKKEERNQQNILHEFLNSEKKQTYNLKMIISVFETVLKQNNNAASVGFPAIEKLIDFHFSFYLKILSCINSDMLIKNVGEVFIEVFDSPEYCDKFVDYYSWTKRQSFRSEKIKVLEIENRAKLEKRTLQDLVASEVQRATKYKLLMEGVLKYSNQCKANEKEYLNRALKIVTKLISDVNDKKGFEDFKFLLSKLDRSEVDKDPVFRSDEWKDYGINSKEIDFTQQPHQAYTQSFALIKFMHKPKQQKSDTKQAQQQPPQQLKIFSNYLVILFPNYLILIERDPHSEKLTWKRYLDADKTLLSIIPTHTIIHATTDSSRPLRSDQTDLVTHQEYNFTCVCPSMQLIVFLSTSDETKKWKALWGECLKNNFKRQTSKHPPASIKMNKSRSSDPEITDPSTFNFESPVTYSIDDPTTAEEYVDKENDQRSIDEKMKRISELRDQTIDLLKQSFDLAREIYDPENTLQRENLSECHDLIFTEQMLSLVDKDLWLRSFDTPISSLNGHLDAPDAVSMNRVEFFISGKEGDSKTLTAETAEEDGVAVSEVKGQLKIFSDQSEEANEVHLQQPGTEDLRLHTERLDQKLRVLDSQLSSAESQGDAEPSSANGSQDFFGICENDDDDSKVAANEEVRSSNVVGDSSRSDQYSVELTESANLVSESNTDDFTENYVDDVTDVSSLPDTSEANTGFSMIEPTTTEGEMPVVDGAEEDDSFQVTSLGETETKETMIESSQLNNEKQNEINDMEKSNSTDENTAAESEKDEDSKKEEVSGSPAVEELSLTESGHPEKSSEFDNVDIDQAANVSENVAAVDLQHS